MQVLVLCIALFMTGMTSQVSADTTHSLQTRLSTKTISATVTAYTPDPRENLGPGKPSATAIGTPIRPGIVAVSRDLLRSGWDFGDKVRIEGLGVFIIEDTMHQRFRRTIDVAVPNVAAARKIGRMRDVTVTLLEKIEKPDG